MLEGYWRLKGEEFDGHRERVAKNLINLRAQITDELPIQTGHKSLLLGTWNIREFDDNRKKQGPRLPESMFYIAEIISAFDIIAVQEIGRALRPVNDLLTLLGRNYDFIMTDTTEGRQGNNERLGFIYNKCKVDFKGIAGEIVLPPNMLISRQEQKLQFARTPFACAFQSGWFRFVFATVHIYYGKDKKDSDEYRNRVDEIDSIAKLLAKRARQSDMKIAEHNKYNYILVGDFNIEDTGSQTSNALTRHGFKAFQNRLGSNHDQTKYYDQISFIPRKNWVQVYDLKKSHGVFNIFQNLFTEDNKTIYEALHPKAGRNFKTWRTYQLSDHLPLWVQLKIDFSDEYLTGLQAPQPVAGDG